ncbi:MAG: hypothetical protein VZQ98_12765 [Bacteroidales bacterium]|nr:hypothetical protein [Bacteroidales bacterium]
MYQKHLYGNVINPQTYQNEQGVYRLIDDSYDTQTESGEWKRVPRETSYDQMGGYFLYGGQGSDMSQSKAKHVYNSIDVSDFPGVTFSGKTSYSRGFWGKLMSIFIIARDVNDAANLGHQAGEKVRGEMEKNEPEVYIKSDTIYDNRKIGNNDTDSWQPSPIYEVDTVIITEYRDIYGNTKIEKRTKKQK